MSLLNVNFHHTGSGNNYKQREDVLIKIGSEGNVIFHGTFAELVETLKEAKVS